MIDVARLRRQIGQAFDDECHLTADEARIIFDVYEAACAWRDDRAQIAGALLTRDYGAADRLCAIIDTARGVKKPGREELAPDPIVDVDVTDVECPTCHAWVGWACKGSNYGYHAAGYHPARHKAVTKEPR